MKWWICLTALVLALTTSAAAADLPAVRKRIRWDKDKVF